MQNHTTKVSAILPKNTAQFAPPIKTHGTISQLYHILNTDPFFIIPLCHTFFVREYLMGTVGIVDHDVQVGDEEPVKAQNISFDVHDKRNEQAGWVCVQCACTLSERACMKNGGAQSVDLNTWKQGECAVCLSVIAYTKQGGCAHIQAGWMSITTPAHISFALQSGKIQSHLQMSLQTCVSMNAFITDRDPICSTFKLKGYTNKGSLAPASPKLPEPVTLALRVCIWGSV